MLIVGAVIDQEIIKNEYEVAETLGYTANCIDSADVNKPGKPSTFNLSRRLLAIFNLINSSKVSGRLVDCGTSVTLIRADM